MWYNIIGLGHEYKYEHVFSDQFGEISIHTNWRNILFDRTMLRFLRTMVLTTLVFLAC